jgi:predicted ATPase
MLCSFFAKPQRKLGYLILAQILMLRFAKSLVRKTVTLSASTQNAKCMITKLEISGFKSFSNFSVDLAPFVVVAGLNGAGKSNLFDAIGLLSDLAKMSIREAFSKQRGAALELFTRYDKDQSATEMEFAVEILLDKTIRDPWGSEAKLEFTRLRYELKIERKPDKNGIERLFLKYEALTPILSENDQWYNTYVDPYNNYWRPKKSTDVNFFIATGQLTRGNYETIVILQQGMNGNSRDHNIKYLESTMLSGASDIQYAHAFAAREAMRNWNLLHLNPEELSKPSASLQSSDQMGPDGAGLASTLYRIKQESPVAFNDISIELMSLVPDISMIDVKLDPNEDNYIISLDMEDGRTFSSKVFSEGTLRMLALLTLKHDEKHQGVLCFEEPENGVNPRRIAQLSSLLRDLSTIFEEDPKADFPLRQVLINTHSPVLVGEVKKMKNFDQWGMLLFARQVTQVKKGHKWKHTLITPVSSEQGNLFWERNMTQGLQSVNREEFRHYLETAKF